jgi:hypothetical protein
MRRSILDIAYVKEGYAVLDFHCPISRPYRAITVGGEPPRLKPGLSSQGPSGRNRLQIRQAPRVEALRNPGLVPITRVALTCPAEGLAKEEGA